MENSNALLNIDTNEIEIMEFTINDNLYGINVAKVKEIMMSDKVKKMPHVHSCVEGIFKPRGDVITVINLPKYLCDSGQEESEKNLFIITNFENMYIAFRVHTVVGISHVLWSDIKKPDKTITSGEVGVTTGIVQCGKDLVTILDFEKIVADIAPETTVKADNPDLTYNSKRNKKHIVVAEDSVLLSKMILSALKNAGYTNIKKFDNGKDAWEYLTSLKYTPDLEEAVSLVITDIEMPQMDGYTLTKLVKTDSILKSVPVIIFSSLINDEMRLKGKQLGAEEQISKPEIVHLVDVMDTLLDVY